MAVRLWGTLWVGSVRTKKVGVGALEEGWENGMSTRWRGVMELESSSAVDIDSVSADSR